MPAENSPPTSLEVRESEAVRTLLSHKQRQAFLPFVLRAQSVTEAARAVGEAPNTMLKRVQRWLGYGLLCETPPHGPGQNGPEPNKSGHNKSGHNKSGQNGRGQKRFRAAALSFFVPQQVIGRLDLEALLEQLDAHEAALMRRGQLEAALEVGDWGLRFAPQGDQDWSIQPARSGLHAWNYDAPDAPAILLETDLLDLSFADAKALQHELLELVRRYGKRAGDARYLVRVGLSPLPAQPDRRGAYPRHRHKRNGSFQQQRHIGTSESLQVTTADSPKGSNVQGGTPRASIAGSFYCSDPPPEGFGAALQGCVSARRSPP